MLPNNVYVCVFTDDENTKTDIKRKFESSRVKHGRACRKFRVDENDLPPYRKRPRISIFSYRATQVPVPDRMNVELTMDKVLASALFSGVPMWRGFNSSVTVNG